MDDTLFSGFGLIRQIFENTFSGLDEGEFRFGHIVGQLLVDPQAPLGKSDVVPTGFFIASSRIAFPADAGGIDEGDDAPRGRFPVEGPGVGHRVSDQVTGQARAFIAEERVDPGSGPAMPHIFGEGPGGDPDGAFRFGQEDQTASGRHKLGGTGFAAIVVPVGDPARVWIEAVSERPAGAGARFIPGASHQEHSAAMRRWRRARAWRWPVMASDGEG